MNRDQSVLAAEDADGRSWTLLRRTLVSGLIIFALLQPAINLFGHPLDGRRWFQLTGAAVLAALAEGDSPLTDRESEVLAASASHDAIADIAGRLHLSPGTVRNHLSAAIQKLGARNRAEAVEIAQQKGWL